MVIVIGVKQVAISIDLDSDDLFMELLIRSYVNEIKRLGFKISQSILNLKISFWFDVVDMACSHKMFFRHK